jgi:HK97 family phage portal protein
MLGKLFMKAVSTLAGNVGLTDPRLYTFLSGGPTFAGESVTPETAMRLDAVFACVRLLSQTISTLPLVFYKRNADGRGVAARDEPMYALLHDRPNSDMTAVTFWQVMITALLLWGNGYAAIERRRDGSVISLNPLLPDRLTVQRQADGSIEYRYNTPNGVETYDEKQIFHIKGFSVDGVVGLSPITQARETLGISLAAEKSAASFYRNSMRPSVVWNAPGYLGENQRKRAKDIIEEFSGSVNAGKTPLIEGGWKLETLTINPQDAQLLSTRAFSIEQICRIYGVPPVMIGHAQGQTAWGSGLEQLGIWFLTYTLSPILRNVEQEVTRSLLDPIERMMFYAEFNADALLRTDSINRASMMQILALNGLRSRDELRALDNLGPVPGGDIMTVAANLLPLDKIGQVAVMPKEKEVSGPPANPPAEPTQSPVTPPHAKPPQPEQRQAA